MDKMKFLQYLSIFFMLMSIVEYLLKDIFGVVAAILASFMCVIAYLIIDEIRKGRMK